MRFRRLALFFLGMWIGVSLFVAFAATRNFASVDSLLQAPPEPAAQVLKSLPPDSARRLLRHLVGEENRSYFENWELAQFGLGLLIAALLFIEPRTRKLAAFPCGMLLLVVFLHFKVTPEVVWLGRQIEFLPAAAASAERREFASMHSIYGAMELTKLLLGLILAGFLVVRRRSTSKHRATGALTSREHAARP